MLTVSPKTVQAFSAANAAGLRRQFIEWAEQHAGIIGVFQRDILAGAFESYAGEARESGIDLDDRRFLYTAARLMMQEMTGLQYLLCMDIIFGEGTDYERLLDVAALRVHSDG